MDDGAGRPTRGDRDAVRPEVDEESGVAHVQARAKRGIPQIAGAFLAFRTVRSGNIGGTEQQVICNAWRQTVIRGERRGAFLRRAKSDVHVAIGALVVIVEAGASG